MLTKLNESVLFMQHYRVRNGHTLQMEKCVGLLTVKWLTLLSGYMVGRSLFIGLVVPSSIYQIFITMQPKTLFENSLEPNERTSFAICERTMGARLGMTQGWLNWLVIFHRCLTRSQETLIVI